MVVGVVMMLLNVEKDAWKVNQQRAPLEVLELEASYARTIIDDSTNCSRLISQIQVLHVCYYMRYTIVTQIKTMQIYSSRWLLEKVYFIR